MIETPVTIDASESHELPMKKVTKEQVDIAVSAFNEAQVSAKLEQNALAKFLQDQQGVVTP